jgi:YjbE family integral membrane protein
VGLLIQYLNPEFWIDMLRHSWAHVGETGFWVAVVQIIWINILLSGDNAVVIAMACRGLKPRQRVLGMIIGAGVASVLLILFTGIIATLMTLPLLKLIGGCALLWVAYDLVSPDSDDASDIEAGESLWRAVRIVVVADIVMSLDNVIAVAAAAQGNYLLLVLGLAISIPIVIGGSAAIMAILARFPILVWAGGALLGWIAGGLLATDPLVAGYVSAGIHLVFDSGYSILGYALKLDLELDLLELACSLLGAIGVVTAGLLSHRSSRSSAHK